MSGRSQGGRERWGRCERGIISGRSQEKREVAGVSEG